MTLISLLLVILGLVLTTAHPNTHGSRSISRPNSLNDIDPPIRQPQNKRHYKNHNNPHSIPKRNFNTKSRKQTKTPKKAKTISAANRTEISIFVESNGELRIESGLSSTADVEAFFIDGMTTIGWGILEVKINKDSSNKNATDSEKMFAAGVAEGYLTSLGIYQTYMNTLNTSFWDFTNGPSNDLIDFMNKQKTYMMSQINDNSNKNDPFWQYASLLNQQLSGLQYGYNLTATSNGVPTYTDSWPFEFLNLVGDLLDLMSALDPSLRLNYKDYTPEEWQRISLMRGRCSALIKVTPELDNLFVGHSSWFIYQNTNRVFKHYIFDFNDVTVATSHMMFSSYPGYLESLDDFYMMDNGLAMVQTTNGIINTTLYDLVTSNSLYAWQRVRIANALSKTGKEWYNYLANQNSGTYNNQYMVVNYGAFKSGQPLPDDFLWVIEQIPGLVLGYDMTDIVERGYWASYNVPAIEEIYNKSGYPELVETQGVSNSYDLAPRARIFRRDSNNVSNMDEYKKIMRYNNYKNDEIENNDPMWAICSRGDLETSGGAPFGCYDSKITNLTMLLNMQAEAINGPTYDDLPPFDWTDWPTYKHAGIPDLMKFDWQFMESELS